MNKFINLIGVEDVINVDYIVSITEETVYERHDLRDSGNKPYDKPYDYFNETMNIGSTYTINPHTLEKEEVTQGKRVKITMSNGNVFTSNEDTLQFLRRVDSILNSCRVSCD